MTKEEAQKMIDETIDKNRETDLGVTKSEVKGLVWMYRLSGK